MSSWRVEINREVCMGSGMCCVYAPSWFDIDSESKAVQRANASASREEIEAAVEACPTGALRLIEGEAAQGGNEENGPATTGGQ